MKPAPFDYIAATTLEEALEALREHGSESKVLAGGQSLVPMMNMRLAQPSVLVDIGRIHELSWIRSNGRISIGAMTRQAAVLADPAVGASIPVVHEALRHVGHAANRSRGTFGGSIAHADPAAELPAVMLALGAEMVVRGRGVERVVAADDFFVTYYTTDIDVDEVLVEVRLPGRRPSAWAFGEVARRHGDFAMAGVVLVADADAEGVVSDSRIVLFGVADRPVRAHAAEHALVGRRLESDAVASEVAGAAPENIQFGGDIHVPEAYRRDAITALVRRAVVDAARNMEVR